MIEDKERIDKLNKIYNYFNKSNQIKKLAEENFELIEALLIGDKK